MSDAFDRFAKIAAGGVLRRDALKYLGGLFAGGFLAALPGRARADDGDGDGDDKHKHKHKRNHEIAERCKVYCRPCIGLKGGVHGHCIEHCKKALRKNPKAVLCGKCSAKAPVTVCQGKTPHCCGNGTCCAAACCGSVCCGAGLICCSGKCVNTSTDVDNCGKCGDKCKTGQKCVKGVCT